MPNRVFFPVQCEGERTSREVERGDYSMPTLQFKGKSFIQNHHVTVPYHELIPVPEKSLTDHVRLEDNLIIHGDNLVALKALLPMYAGLVKCIYIDPPYNTGAERWVYNDNVNSPLIRDWLGKTVDKDDLTRHDKWLCMMMPRLTLLWELLRDDGIIFITCDDNEQAHLRMLMDEIFGEGNFIASVAWEKRYTRSNNAKLFYSLKDFVLIYRKTDKVQVLREPRTEKSDSIYKNPDNDPRGVWTSSSYVNPATKEERQNLVYPIVNPFTGQTVEHETHAWKYELEEHKRHVRENRLWWGKNGDAKFPRLKNFLSEAGGGLVPIDVWRYDVAGTSDEGGTQLKEIFGKEVFDNPKPTKLIRKMLELALSHDEDEIVLDSFAGSGSTGQAVLEFNRDHETNHKFILIEMEDYADAVTAERMRRVISGVRDAEDPFLRDGLGGTFSFLELGHAIDLQGLLTGDHLPTYNELARYVFYTATAQEFRPDAVDETRWFIGETEEYEVYLLYVPDIEQLKTLALNMDFVRQLGRPNSPKRRLVFAPARYLTDNYLEEFKLEYAQLPYELYRTRGRA